MAAMVQRHYKSVCGVTLTDEQAQEIADALHEEIFEMADALAGPDIPGETFMEKVGRLTTADATARQTDN